MELIQIILIDLAFIGLYLVYENYRKGSKIKRNKRVNQKRKRRGPVRK